LSHNPIKFDLRRYRAKGARSTAAPHPNRLIQPPPGQLFSCLKLKITMTTSDFARALARVLVHEGGYNDPFDPGAPPTRA
jgi:hypothetical protein